MRIAELEGWAAIGMPNAPVKASKIMMAAVPHPPSKSRTAQWVDTAQGVRVCVCVHALLRNMGQEPAGAIPQADASHHSGCSPKRTPSAGRPKIMSFSNASGSPGIPRQPPQSHNRIAKIQEACGKARQHKGACFGDGCVWGRPILMTKGEPYLGPTATMCRGWPVTRTRMGEKEGRHPQVRDGSRGGKGRRRGPCCG